MTIRDLIVFILMITLSLICFNVWISYQKSQYICSTQNYDWFYNNHKDWASYKYLSWDSVCMNANWETKIIK